MKKGFNQGGVSNKYILDTIKSLQDNVIIFTIRLDLSLESLYIYIYI